MASVSPCTPPGFDRGDQAGTLRSVCGYLRTMQEELGVRLSSLQKENDALRARVEALERGGRT